MAAEVAREEAEDDARLIVGSAHTVPIESGITGVFWLDILFWPGIIVDMVTGDYKTLDVPEVSATLTPLAANTAGTAPPVPAASGPIRPVTPQRPK